MNYFHPPVFPLFFSSCDFHQLQKLSQRPTFYCFFLFYKADFNPISGINKPNYNPGFKRINSKQ